MTDQPQIADLLHRANEVFALAGNLSEAFHEAGQWRAIFYDPSIWEHHEPQFEEFCNSLVELREVMQHPPDGFANVADQLRGAARIAKGIRESFAREVAPDTWRRETMGRLIGIEKPGTPKFTKYMDFAPSLAAIAESGEQAVKEVRKSLRLDEPFAFLDDQGGSESAKQSLSLLDRYPATTAGHVAFLEWVSIEVREQANALRENRYTHESITRQIKNGVKWAEARQRITLLQSLPAETVKQVASVLRRELSLGTVEQIDELLRPSIRALRNALEATPQSQTTGQSTGNTHEFESFVNSVKQETNTTGFLAWAGGDRVTLAIVFTDIVGSTAMGQRLGDEAMNEIRRTHFAQSRKLIDQFQGREIKTIGDSFMTAFKSVGLALDYAQALQSNTGHPEVRIRAGIHIGSMKVEDGDVFGGTVDFASRVVGTIKDAEIWLSDRAREDVEQLGSAKHKQLKWESHEGIAMKGFADRFTLWSLK